MCPAQTCPTLSILVEVRPPDDLSSTARTGALRRRGICAVAATLVSLGLCACGAAAHPSSPTISAPQTTAQATTAAQATTTAQATAAAVLTAPVAEAPCGAAAPATVADTIGLVAKRIYDGEISSGEVGADRNQVERNGPLLSALAAGNRAAVGAAVTSLVYSGTHIVRLRVTQGGTVLADVGGPYILAPVSGTLHFQGRSVGRYTLSVQDDLGYVKLASRFIGYPLILRQGSHRVPLEGTISDPTLATHGPASYHGSRYQVFSFDVQAFPSGPLTISLLVPMPASSSVGCPAFRAIALGHVAQTMWHRFTSIGASPSAYVTTVGTLTGALSYVRSGSNQLAGSTQPGPRRLPAAGTVSYRGATYRVTSFPASTGAGPVRVYQLFRS